jgi:hypothetical protein
MSNKPAVIFNIATDTKEHELDIRSWFDGYCTAGNIKLSGNGIEDIRIEVDQDEAIYMLGCLENFAESGGFYIAGGYIVVE